MMMNSTATSPFHQSWSNFQLGIALTFVDDQHQRKSYAVGEHGYSDLGCVRATGRL